MLKLENYKNDDYEDLVSLLKSNDLYDETWETKEALERKIKQDPDTVIVAKIDNKIVGCVFVMVHGWMGMVCRLCVEKQYQKQGIGSKLLEAAENLVRQKGVKEVSLFVDSEKECLKDWYRKNGYKSTRDFTFLFKG